MTSTAERQCRDCGEVKALDDFRLTTTKSRSGEKSWTYRRPECVRCHKAANAARFQSRKHLWQPARDRWYLRNFEKTDFHHAQTRARKAGATAFLSFEEWLVLRANKNCHWCECELHPSFRNVDHVQPLAFGGQHTAENVVMSCANCNQRREWERKATRRNTI